MNHILAWMRLCIFAVILGTLSKVTILSAQTIITQPTNQVVLLGSNTTFSVSVAESGLFSYQWQFNGSNIPNNTIVTIAGSGPSGQFAGDFSGDGGMATNSRLNYPDGITVDAQGSVFFADLYNQRIRKVGTSNIITTVAGNGVQGGAGNGGAAINANLSQPMGVAVDGVGNLFIADYANGAARRVDTNGLISTLPNSSRGRCADVAADAVGNIFAVYASGSIVKFASNGVAKIIGGGGTNYLSDGIQATNADLLNPVSIAVDSRGNIFVAERGGHHVRKIDTNGIITSIAGIFDSGGNSIGGFSGDGGAATNATLYFPNGLDVDAKGNVFIADSYNHRIRMVDTNGIITTVAGGGFEYFSEGPAYFQYPQAVALDAVGNIFVADMWNQRIRKVAYAGLPVLTINNVTTNNAGNYSVIITGSSGSVTSSIVSLVVTGTPPSVIIQPASQSVTVGASVSLTANASGTPPLSYQWKFNGTNINGATDSTLSLNLVFPANAGAFTVAVTNAWGGVVSDAATLSVLSIPIVAPRFVGNGQFQFGFDTTAGVNYTIEYSTNLFQWFSLLTIGGVGGPILITDPNAFNSQRFYRAVLSP
jgi:sugar lactone lactonase YvrE